MLRSETELDGYFACMCVCVACTTFLFVFTVSIITGNVELRGDSVEQQQAGRPRQSAATLQP